MYLQLLGRVSFQNTAERTYTGHGRAVTIMGNWVEQRQQQYLDTCTPTAPVPANPEASQLLEVGITAAAATAPAAQQATGWWSRPLTVARCGTAGSRMTDYQTRPVEIPP